MRNTFPLLFLVDEQKWALRSRFCRTSGNPLNSNLAKSLTRFCPKPSPDEFLPVAFSNSKMPQSLFRQKEQDRYWLNFDQV